MKFDRGDKRAATHCMLELMCDVVTYTAMER